MPNLPHTDAPDGETEDDNVVVNGPHHLLDEYPEHQRVPHWETGAALGILDNERAIKISGSMFTMTRGLGATMGRALCQLALDRNADAMAYVTATYALSTEDINGIAPEAPKNRAKIAEQRAAQSVLATTAAHGDAVTA